MGKLNRFFVVNQGGIAMGTLVIAQQEDEGVVLFLSDEARDILHVVACRMSNNAQAAALLEELIDFRGEVVLGKRDGSARLVFKNFPASMKIFRKEIAERMKRENSER